MHAVSMLLAALLVGNASAGADAAPNVAEDARDWLRQMSEASQGLNYRGTFVYLHNGRLEAIQILHRAAEGNEQERMIALTGEAREVIRDNERVTCILPKSKSVMVDKSIPRKPFPAALPHDLDALTNTYEFLVAGEDRVSGLPARIVVIKPRDAYRYGYRLWLDKATSLLLRSDLTDAEGRPVEQMMFTDMQILDALPEDDLAPALQGKDYTVVDHADSKTATADTDKPRSDWVVSGLPTGFMLTHHNRHAMHAAAGEVEHLVFSDGLATVSVYIESHQPDKQAPSGLSSMGAVHALAVRRGEYQMTVVGEVPRRTVERIEQSMQHRP
ncbi:MAG: MucB/RseB C-terminal domain-containing protein [Gammaproteobacteria bacterium]|nr:MucB/RseB C-terminal domain-containing protein [Gammaproteobacteria bacterium]MBU2478849.1 MucB/RseB C-terminal domain-containing protein [Gammaproteobacteria bacterium]